MGWSATRVIGALALAASVPLLAAITPMWALVVVVGVLGVMLAVEGLVGSVVGRESGDPESTPPRTG